MVGKVLTGNSITRYDKGAYDLVGGEKLSDAERGELLQLCRQLLAPGRVNTLANHTKGLVKADDDGFRF
jgi:hypothetical protein